MERPVSDLLDPSCGVPPDIVFKIIDPETKTSLGEVGAHKTILSLRVPVFQRQFHGELSSPACVTVEDSTLEAFRMFIGHIYQAKEDWTSLPLNEIFRIAALAEKYFLTCLMEKVLECLNNISINDDNIIETATVAEQFHLYPAAYSAVLDSCASYIKRKQDEDPLYYARFAYQHCNDHERGMTAFRLLGRVNKLAQAEEIEEFMKIVRENEEMVRE